MAILALCVIFFMLKTTSTLSLDREPRCSKFEYEEKTLEKMIRLEHSTGLIMETFKELVITVKTDTANMKREFEEIKRQAQEQRERVNDSVDNMTTAMKDYVETMKIDMANLKQELVKTVKSDMTTIKVEFEAMEEHAQREMERVNETLQEEIRANRNITKGFEDLMTVYMNTTNHSIDSLSKYTRYASAFTAWCPSSISVTEPIKFATALSNIGSDYDSSSGNFTCRFPGIYMFNLNLYKHQSYSSVYCKIRKNGVNTVVAYNDLNSSADGGAYEASNSVVLHLNRGDVVTVGGCNGYIHRYSSFTGFLVKAD